MKKEYFIINIFINIFIVNTTNIHIHVDTFEKNDIQYIMKVVYLHKY